MFPMKKAQLLALACLFWPSSSSSSYIGNAPVVELGFKDASIAVCQTVFSYGEKREQKKLSNRKRRGLRDWTSLNGQPVSPVIQMQLRETIIKCLLVHPLLMMLWTPWHQELDCFPRAAPYNNNNSCEPALHIGRLTRD